MKTFGTRQERPRKIVAAASQAVQKTPAKAPQSARNGRSIMFACAALAAVGAAAGIVTSAVSQEPARAGKPVGARQVVVEKSAVTTAAPLPAGDVFRVSGFRSARFGMTREQVQAAIAKDLKVAPAAIKAIDNTVDGTMALMVGLDALEPAPGIATVTYIFGKASRTLIHVNVVWELPANSQPVQRDLMVSAGTKLGHVFAARDWGTAKKFTNVPVATNGIVLFLARDEAGAAIELRMDGVSYLIEGKEKSVQSPAPTGPQRLRLSYALNPEHPDVARIAAGQF